MHRKGSMWMLLTTAVLALASFALIGHGMSPTGDVTGNRQTTITQTLSKGEIAYIRAAATDAKAEEMARIERHACYLINLQLDRDAGMNTPPNKISTVCPAWA